MFVLTNARVFDGSSEEILGGTSVVIEGARIREVTSSHVQLKDAQVLDCGGRLLMPGLIDAHFHACSPSLDLALGDRMPASLMAAHAARILEGTLRRGFTTVRDAAGADAGLAQAVELGLVRGPRLFVSGKALSQTGGHGDLRAAGQLEPCGCGQYHGSLSMVADGADEMRRAVREQLRQGAHQIKLFLSGGVLSPTDPLWMPQFSAEEILVAVQEAATRRTYVMAHCHTDEGARRCVDLGVRSIEHGTEIRDSTAALIAGKGLFVVPTLSIAALLQTQGKDLGVPQVSMAKLQGLYAGMLESIEACNRAGVKLGLGTDLLDHRFHALQGREFKLRAEVSRPIDVLRSATSVNAELLQRGGELGCIRAGAYADLLVLDNDPLVDIESLGRPEESIALLMKAGELVKNRL